MKRLSQYEGERSHSPWYTLLRQTEEDASLCLMERDFFKVTQ